jgi:hypothetical protein
MISRGELRVILPAIPGNRPARFMHTARTRSTASLRKLCTLLCVGSCLVAGWAGAGTADAAASQPIALPAFGARVAALE